jgi:hypothetical protein
MKYAAALLLVFFLGPQDQRIRIGIIGLDCSHAVDFTKLIQKRADAAVVAAFRAGSPDIEASAARIDKFTSDIQKLNVVVVDSVDELLKRVDAVLITSVDGRAHLEQARKCFAAHKRVFIDKPLAASLKDGREIAQLSRESGTPFFSASAFRFFEPMRRLKELKPLGCDAYSPATEEPHHPGLFWYGIHGVEIVYTLMGPGCESVRYSGDVVVARWKDGRSATLRAIRKGGDGYGVTVLGEKKIRHATDADGPVYDGPAEAIVKFFQTGEAPVPPDEMLEVLAFMEAAEESRTKDGAPIRIAW